MDTRFLANALVVGILFVFLGVLVYYDSQVYDGIYLGEETVLNEILPYANPTVDDLPPVTEDGSHLTDIPPII